MSFNDHNQQGIMPSTYLKVILQQLLSSGLFQAGLLHNTGLDMQALLNRDTGVSFEQTRKILSNANQILAPGWHIKQLQSLSISAHGALGFACVTAPTLRVTVDVLLRFIGTRVPFFWLAGGIEKKQFVLRMYEATTLKSERNVLVELTLLGVQALLERPLGRAIESAEIRLAYPAPHYREQLEEAFHPKLVFAASGHSLRFPADWLAEPCLLSDPAMHRYLISRCLEELNTISGAMPAEVAVRQALLANPERLPKLTEIAASMHISSRTLIRRLQAGQTSYHAILEHVRKTLAVDYLRHADMTIASIAYRLGYQDPSNFGRAFRGWFGCPPGYYRHKHDSVMVPNKR